MQSDRATLPVDVVAALIDTLPHSRWESDLDGLYALIARLPLDETLAFAASQE